MRHDMGPSWASHYHCLWRDTVKFSYFSHFSHIADISLKQNDGNCIM